MALNFTHGKSSCRDYKYPSFHPLCRAFEDEGKARLGVVECAKHELLQPFSVLSEKEGEDLHWLFDSFSFFYIFSFLSPRAIIKSTENGIRLFSSLSLGEFVAQFKFTVLLMANGPLRITSGPFEPELYKSEFDVQDPELKVSNMVLQQSIPFTTGWNVVALKLSWMMFFQLLKNKWRIAIANFSWCSFHVLFQSLIQSSASRKAQKKKKKKVRPSVSDWHVITALCDAT